MSEQVSQQNHTLEDQLLIDCAQSRMSSRQIDGVSKLFSNSLDWKFILNISTRNAVSSLVARNLLHKFDDLLPTEIKEVLSAHFQTNLQRNMFLTGKLLEIVRLFEANQIPVLPFKGPLLAARAYGDLSFRQYGDLDVLVQPKHFDAAVQLLKSKNYRPVTSIGWLYKSDWYLSPRKDIYFRSADGMVNIELHWKLSGSHFSLPFEMNRLWARLETIYFADVELRTLPFDDLLIYLCLHGSRHGWERFGWICDVNELIRSKENIEWDKVFENAKQLGCENVLGLGLYLVNEFFDWELPMPEWQKIKNDEIFITYAKLIRSRLFAEHRVVMEIGDRYSYHLRLKENRWDKWKLHFHYVSWYARIILIPNEVDRNLFHFPRLLTPLYYIMRPLRLLYTFATKTKTKIVTK